MRRCLRLACSIEREGEEGEMYLRTYAYYVYMSIKECLLELSKCKVT